MITSRENKIQMLSECFNALNHNPANSRILGEVIAKVETLNVELAKSMLEFMLQKPDYAQNEDNLLSLLASLFGELSHAPRICNFIIGSSIITRATYCTSPEILGQAIELFEVLILQKKMSKANELITLIQSNTACRVPFEKTLFSILKHIITFVPITTEIINFINYWKSYITDESFCTELENQIRRSFGNPYVIYF